MKIATISKTNYDVKNNNELKNNAHYSGSHAKIGDSVSFGTSGKKAVGIMQNAISKAFEGIEKGGFFITFLIVDTISMVLPRIIIGLNRDKEKLGHLNYQAGKEEAGREILSGPSMNLIPMGITAGINMALLSAHMSKDTLAGLTNNMTEIIKEGSPDKATLKNKLAEKIFDDAFGNFKYGKDAAKNDKIKAGLKSRFTKLLTEAETLKGEDYKQQVKAFEKQVAIINNLKNQETPTNDVKFIKITKGIKEDAQTGKKEILKTSVEAKDFIKDFKDYSKDIIEKFIKKNPADDKAVEFFENAKNTRYGVKIATAVAAFFAVGAFLKILPKFYQQGKISPAAQSAKRAEGGK